VLALTPRPELYRLLRDEERPVRHTANAYHQPFRFSIVPPGLAWFAIQYWSAPGELVLDPFGNRANIGLIANLLGRKALLNDIVPSYCAAMEERGRSRPRGDLDWKILCSDAAELPGVADASVDFIITGPPYHNLERYERVPGQAACLGSYERFLDWYGRVAEACLRVLRPGRFCLFKVGRWRVKGELNRFPEDTVAAFKAVGWRLHEELITVQPAPQGLAYSWRQKWTYRYVSKAHQTCLVFRKPA
jgi:DNA modification methylase